MEEDAMSGALGWKSEVRSGRQARVARICKILATAEERDHPISHEPLHRSFS